MDGYQQQVWLFIALSSSPPPPPPLSHSSDYYSTMFLFNKDDELVWKETFLERRSMGMYEEDHRKLAVREFLKASCYSNKDQAASTITTTSSSMDDKVRACLGLIYTKCQLEGKDFEWAASAFSARAIRLLCLESSSNCSPRPLIRIGSVRTKERSV
jgi:hypothetical protein